MASDPISALELAMPITQRNGDPGTISYGMGVRRLVPVECEALQAFPRDYTNIPKAADGPRYKALGNSMCVNVMAFIGRRIHLANGRQLTQEAA
jgi:DNA (cytosine-5)-methyltransferase 1